KPGGRRVGGLERQRIYCCLTPGASVDHLVGGGEQLCPDFEAKRCGQGEARRGRTQGRRRRRRRARVPALGGWEPVGEAMAAAAGKPLPRVECKRPADLGESGTWLPLGQARK